MEWTFEDAGLVEADVEVPSGSVEIRPAEDGRVVVVLEPADPFDRVAGEIVEASEVSLSAGRLRVHVPSRRFRDAAVRCVVAVTAEPALSFRTASADLSCEVPIAALTGSTASGRVRVLEVEQDASLSTASGDVTFGGVGGRLRFRGASSDLHIGILGGDGELALASGDLRIEEAARSVTVQTASGDVSIARVSDGRVSVSTASGDVVIGVAQGAGAFLDVSSVSGDMDCELPFTDASAEEAAVRIVCRTVSGDVRVEAAS
ncbi:MAG TPA: DUF4097 family beta strand repeat-containing protein [Acidimicrobiales bacterium]|nr:DUF4097 family beta strand repeat-containing protein [Acidimicrobiales bacterium]